MGLRINTNVLSLNAQRNLQSTSKSLGKALERLSSGSRINRAGDDAAGLAISEGLRSQVRGLRQAVRNANDSLGFLNTAEGALSEITNITQRLRELAIQASNGAIGSKERGFLDDEVDALLSEFNRIAVQTEFNGTKLLDGSFVSTELQVGVNKGETIEFTIGDARTTNLGALAIKSGFQNRLDSGFSGVTLGADQTTLSVSASDDALSSTGNAYSAIAIAAAVNAATGTTGVSADVQDTVVQLNDVDEAALTAAASTTAGDFQINGVDIVGSVATTQDFVDTINDFSSSTGVTARFAAGSSDDIELVAADGRNIDLTIASATAAITTGSFFVEAFIASSNVIDTASTVNAYNRLFTAGGANLTNGSGVSDVFTGAVQLSSSETIIIGGTAASLAFGFSDSVIAVSTDNAVFSIDVTTQDSAQDALSTIDATLSQLNELRSSLGAVQNRLESTIRNLSISLENISAAESQIRDADIAQETAELTRSQILQQAGIAVLGQANTSSQVALSLLNF